MKLVSISSLLVVSVAVAIAYFSRKTPSYLPWHNNENWDRLLNIYDQQAAIQYSDCNSSLIDTHFGKIQVHACGDPENPTVLFLHGAGASSLIYGDWLVPGLKDSHYCVSVDYPCDTGRSSPKDMDPKNCPATEVELAEWVQEIVSQVSISNPVSLVGYSYGSLVSFLVALHKPQLVDKLVLIAPAAVFAPIEFSWIWRAIVYSLTSNDYTQNWFFRFMSADPHFSFDKLDPLDRNLTQAVRLVGGTILTVPANSFENEELQKVIVDHPTLLMIGEEETVTNATLAAERAKNAGASVKVYPRAGHLMLMEQPTRTQIAQDVVHFLAV